MEHKVKTAVIGSGRISGQYLQNMIHHFTNLEVTAIASLHLDHAQAKAEEFGIEARTVEGILEDPSIELVVVLVPTPSHYDLIRRALLAGKHVYTEKTMTETLEQAAELVALAKERGLYLGSAPDTFLGVGMQTARKAIDDGLIGEVLSFSLNINRNLDWTASMYEFLRLPGGGFAYDYGVYYLTALVSLLGPVKDLYSVVKNKAAVRINCAPGHPDFGKPYPYDNESQIYALMNLESGVTGTVSMNGDSNSGDLPFFYIYGTGGILKLPCANDFIGRVEYLPNHIPWQPQDTIVLEPANPVTMESRGIGPAEMMLARAENRPCRASAEMAYHVLDIISTLMASSDAKTPMEVPSTCTRPAPLTGDTYAQLTK